jgi:glycine/D-amino acid oxidase-like deaminating enzyme
MRSAAALAALGAVPGAAMPGVASDGTAPHGERAHPAGRTAVHRGAGPRVAVVGAGAFGGWAALSLRRRGARVTLFDPWGPANERASSAGETRVIRAIYGADRSMVRMATRALHLWQKEEPALGLPVLERTGALWMAREDDALLRDSLPLLREADLPYDELTIEEAARRFPAVDFSGVRRVVFERHAGFLHARDACRAVVRAFVAAGGTYRQAEVRPAEDLTGPPPRSGELRLADGTTFTADRYLFACGPWLGGMFPDLIGERIRPTRQEVFVFGPPFGDHRYDAPAMPVWVDLGPPIIYGVPAGAGRGFKVADDTRGESFDPTTGNRLPSHRGLKTARAFLAHRFPGLEDAPLVEADVCQYENSPDGRFLIDRHPQADSVFILGGGSGHGFKHGPALGELAAAMVMGDAPPDPAFSLGRFRS